MLDRDLGKTGQFDTDGILLTTRTKAVLERIRVSDEYHIEPESFQRGLYPHWGILRRSESDELFLLTERDLIQINIIFWSLPLKLIDFYINSRARGEEIRILDIGGGRDGSAAREIASRHSFAQVVNVDMVAINERRSNFTSRRENICNLQLEAGSIDFAYSHQVLPYMSDEDDYRRHNQVIDGVAGTLKPGGTAVIDCTNYTNLPEAVLRSIDRRLDVQFIPKRKSYGGGFLFIAKNPVAPAIVDISTLAPDLAA